MEAPIPFAGPVISTTWSSSESFMMGHPSSWSVVKLGMLRIAPIVTSPL
jgi:hypothetical protein